MGDLMGEPILALAQSLCFLTVSLYHGHFQSERGRPLGATIPSLISLTVTFTQKGAGL